MTADGDAASQTRVGAEEGTDDRPVQTRTRTLVLATNNAKKLTELRRLLAEQHLDLDVLGLADVTAYPEPAETERTFEGNALLKARACRSATGYPALADDSGIEVDLNVVTNDDGRFIEVQGTAEGLPFDRAMLDALLDLGVAGTAELTRLQREALAR